MSEDQINSFIENWVAYRKEKECIYYDSIAISSTAQNISWLARGYSAHKFDNEQLKTGMYLGVDSGLPVLFDVFNGSIVDNTHLEYMIKRAENFGTQNSGCIIDRGYNSRKNLHLLYAKGIQFLTPITEDLAQINPIFYRIVVPYIKAKTNCKIILVYLKSVSVSKYTT
ncbi:MAG: transposase [Christensenellaceae bacterium]|jgi:transposase|nr:transposase [Christensenellaceae bacterium]